MPAMVCLRFSPSVMMFAPSCMETPSPSAGLPSWRTRKVGGSSYPRLTVAMSPRRKLWPSAWTGTAAMAATPENAPVTRRLIRSAEVSTEPPETTAFCLATLSKICCGVTPSVASLAWLNSMKIFSGRSPMMSTLLTPATRNRVWRMSSARALSSASVSPSAVSIYSAEYTSPYSSLKFGPTMPGGRSPLTSPTFLRT